MQPCEQKETINNIQEHLTELRINQKGIAGDVSHIKTRIDNGMSHTIKDIHDKVTSMIPIIEHHASIVKKVEDIGWLISRYALVSILTVIAGLIVWAISKGFVPKL